MSIISDAYAQVAGSAQATAEPNAIMNLLPLILIFAVFYVFLIRPQQKKLKEHAALINAVKRGDEVVTGGGIIGRISKIEDGSPIAFVEIADGVIVRVNKATIIEVTNNAPASVKEKIEAPKVKKNSSSKKSAKKAA